MEGGGVSKLVHREWTPNYLPNGSYVRPWEDSNWSLTTTGGRVQQVQLVLSS